MTKRKEVKHNNTMTPTPDQKARAVLLQYLSGDARSDQKASAEYLRSAQPRLICRVDVEEGREGRRSKLTSYISEVERGWDEIISEGYDPDHSPLGCPVYWRIVTRGDEQFYCSTFPAKRDQIIKAWGTRGLAYCDPVTGMAVARIETYLGVADGSTADMQELNAAYDEHTERTQKAPGETPEMPKKTKKH